MVLFINWRSGVVWDLGNGQSQRNCYKLQCMATFKNISCIFMVPRRDLPALYAPATPKDTTKAKAKSQINAPPICPGRASKQHP